MRHELALLCGLSVVLGGCEAAHDKNVRTDTRRLVVTGTREAVNAFTTTATVGGTVSALTVRPTPTGSIAALTLAPRADVLQMTRDAVRSRLSYRYEQRSYRSTTT
ncbi:MAG: hypothetical protein V4659_04900 [Pseudomonadota bacterium]